MTGIDQYPPFGAVRQPRGKMKPAHHAKADLPGPPRHHPGGSAGARSHAAVPGGQVRQRRQPQPPLRMGSREGGGAGPQTGGRRWPARPPREIVFTSGATESNNLAIKGAMEACRSQRRAHRHHGHRAQGRARPHPPPGDDRVRGVTVLAPGRDGLLDLDRLRAAIRPETVLVSVMAANNEIGVLQPVREIGAICRERGVLFHCDAAQAFGKIPIDVDAGPYRPDVHQRPQDVRPQGRGRSVRAAPATRGWTCGRRWMAAATSSACARAP